MRARGFEPLGGPRQLQAVPADETVATHLDLSVGVPVLLLHGVTQDETGRGLEWFTAWHRPDPVFDVDAQVLAHAPQTQASGSTVGGGLMKRRRSRTRRRTGEELAHCSARLRPRPPGQTRLHPEQSRAPRPLSCFGLDRLRLKPPG
ncbi:MAG: UTRA domain-containing protein [Actinomycetales bacterium]